MSDTYRFRLVDADGRPLVWDRATPPDPATVAAYGVAGYDVHLWLASNDAGGYDLRRFDVLARAGGPAVGAAALRGFRIGGLLDAASRYLAHAAAEAAAAGDLLVWSVETTWTQHDDTDMLAVLFRSLDLPAPTTGEDGRPRAGVGTADALRKLGPSSHVTAKAVGAAYAVAAANDWAPAAFVGQFFDIPRSTATHWVKLARQAGTIAPATRKRRSDG